MKEQLGDILFISFVIASGEAIMRALYGIKCVLRIFLTNMAEHIVEEKKFLRFVNTGFRVTHSTNEDLLNIKRKGDPEVSYPLL